VTKQAPPNPVACAVPDWVIQGARLALMAVLKAVLTENDPFDYNLNNQTSETDLWVCNFKVNASTDLQLSGLGTIQNSAFECKESVCLEEGGWTGCNKYQHTLSATIGIGSLGITGKDRSQWECGFAFPPREMDIAWNADGIGITAEFVLEQTTTPLNAQVVEVLDIVTQMGATTNHSCMIQGLDLGWLCGPTIELLSGMLGSAGLKPIIDWALEETLDYILRPADPEDPDAPVPPVVQLAP